MWGSQALYEHRPFLWMDQFPFSIFYACMSHFETGLFIHASITKCPSWDSVTGIVLFSSTFIALFKKKKELERCYFLSQKMPEY
jgi:hypothetical protein